MKFKTYLIDKNYENVYYFLKDQGFSEIYISSLRKKSGQILINNQVANTRSSLKAGDFLMINLSAKKASSFKPNMLKLDIIYEDDQLLIVNKPSGLTTSPSRSHYDENLSGAILNYMQEKDPDFVVRIVNRLDKDTAGIVIVAKDIITYNKIGEINKVYHAICSGIIEHDTTINEPIETISNNGINQLKRIVSPLGKPAKTFVKPIKILDDNSTLLEISLEHGRTHQIRVHLSHINHALIGDEVYGTKSDRISHTALLCKEIEFTHPKTGKKINLEVDYPEDFKLLLSK